MWKLCFVSNIKYADDSLILEFSKQTNCNVVDEELLCQTTSAKKVQSSQFLPTQNTTIYQFVLMMVWIFYQLILNIISWIIILTSNIIKQILIDF